MKLQSPVPDFLLGGSTNPHDVTSVLCLSKRTPVRRMYVLGLGLGLELTLLFSRRKAFRVFSLWHSQSCSKLAHTWGCIGVLVQEAGGTLRYTGSG